MVVYCGADALVADPNYLPDVMLLDISMPKMDGNELARQTLLVGKTCFDCRRPVDYPVPVPLRVILTSLPWPACSASFCE